MFRFAQQLFAIIGNSVAHAIARGPKIVFAIVFNCRFNLNSELSLLIPFRYIIYLLPLFLMLNRIQLFHTALGYRF